MKKLPLLALLVAACASNPKPCVPEGHIDALYGQAANRIIDSGECAKYPRVEDCPPYAALELHYAAALEGTCQP